MIKMLLPVVLCGSFLAPVNDTPGPENVKIGAWTIECEANAQSCRVAQSLTSPQNPETEWLQLVIMPQHGKLYMGLLLPHLAVPMVRLILDQQLDTEVPAVECTAEQCVFAIELDTDSKALFTQASELDLQFSLKAGQVIDAPVDLRRLEDALKALPNPS